MIKIENPKSCSLCGDSAQIVETKSGKTYICGLYCSDCLHSEDHGYIHNDTIVYGLSIISKRRARKKAIKAWNRRANND